MRDAGKPVVCFTGKMPKTRALMLQEASDLGWEVCDTAISAMDVLVAADPNGNSAKLKLARALSIPILSGEEWLTLLSGVVEDATGEDP